MQLTPAQVRGYAQQAGFTGAGLDTIVQIAGAETGGSYDTQATSPPNTGPGLGACYGSIDRGIVQINDCAHAQIGQPCMYDPLCAMNFAFSLSRGGTYFGDWTTFTGGQYQGYSTGADGAALPLPSGGGTGGAPAATSQGGAGSAGGSTLLGLGLPSPGDIIGAPGKIAGGIGDLFGGLGSALGCLTDPSKCADKAIQATAGALAKQVGSLMSAIGAALKDVLLRAGVFLAGLVAIGIGGMILASGEVKQAVTVAAQGQGQAARKRAYSTGETADVAPADEAALAA
jgi:hypothetical protein